jgi:hypothetical protein
VQFTVFKNFTPLVQIISFGEKYLPGAIHRFQKFYPLGTNHQFCTKNNNY